ncbi:hypothetical protein JET18_13415 [Chryseobacterium sp. L7]|uniref:LPXTG cell wall anchor domain-containing protein n=1 Tax=Chryseobacterium endalhagicum TaxID=2797638 RepID=A0ABS1QGW5_9FLAO|nr:hypothetical protein [Chryseobacterium endalhagicum]MBL1221845.1 hypothetical protein [Chryseobacterium endalhagicum]
MKTISSFLALLISISVFSQTKLIAFKSHSGHAEYFDKAISEDLFDANFSNLGIVPKRFVTDAKLDSVIILNDEESILVTSSASRIMVNNEKREWQPGRETVRKHPLFSKKNIDSVKTVLKRDYHFINDMDSVVFVEYDKQNKSYKEIKPSTAKPKKGKSDKTRGGLLLGVLMISGVSGFYSWKRNKKNNEK